MLPSALRDFRSFPSLKSDHRPKSVCSLFRPAKERGEVTWISRKARRDENWLAPSPPLGKIGIERKRRLWREIFFRRQNERIFSINITIFRLTYVCTCILSYSILKFVAHDIITISMSIGRIVSRVVRRYCY